MRKELFETGKTVDWAIDSACEKLGCQREDCEWEIIDLPKKGFLGLKNTPAKVRVSIEVPDEKPQRGQNQPETQPLTAQNTEKSKQIKKPEPKPVPKQEYRPEPKPVQKQESKPEYKPAPKQEMKSTGQPEPLRHEELTEKERNAAEYLSQVIEAAGLTADYVITREHGGCCINIVGDGLGMIIGRRGETLDALQYLTGLASNRGDGEYLRLTIDCGSYRLKRKETLETLAKRLASQVLKTNVSKVLEPMNPFERRVIHATVSGIEGVSSSSIGEEPMRRVVITSPTARPAPRGNGYRAPRQGDGDRPPRMPREGDGERPPRPPRENRGEGYGGGRRGRDDRRGGGGGGRGPRRPDPIPQGPPKQTPESETTTGISFGKIDLE